MGAGNKRTRATIGAPPDSPLAKEFAAMLRKSIDGNMNLRNTNAIPDTKTLNHHGHSTSRLSMDSSFRGISPFFSCKMTLCAMPSALRDQDWANFFVDETIYSQIIEYLVRNSCSVNSSTFDIFAIVERLTNNHLLSPSASKTLSIECMVECRTTSLSS